MLVWYFNQLHTLWYVEKLKPCWNLRKPAETRKGFLYCWNCTETYYMRFQLTETLRKLFSSFPHCWNLTETYTSGFRWRKLDGIQLNLYNSFHIAETIQETSTPCLYIVSAVFQFCWNGIFHPVNLTKLTLMKHCQDKCSSTCIDTIICYSLFWCTYFKTHDRLPWD